MSCWAMRNASSSGRADPADMMCVSDSSRGHGHRNALEQVHHQDRVHRALDRDPARLALTLAGVPVAEGEQCAGDVDAEVAGNARRASRACPCCRRTRRAPARCAPPGSRALPRPCRASGPSAGPPRTSCRRALNRQVRAAVSSCHSQTTSGSGGLQQRGQVRAGERAEQRHGGRCGPVPAGSIDTKCTATVSPGSAPSM